MAQACQKQTLLLKRHAVCCLAFLLLWLAVQQLSAASTPAVSKQVLVLHSDNPYLPANMIIDESLFGVLKGSSNPIVSMYGEYLELVRFTSPEHQASLIQLLKSRYVQIALDLIIITDDLVWNFYQAHREDLFPDTPVVLCGLSQDRLGTGALDKLVTGNFKDSPSSIRNTMAMAAELFPQTRELYIVSGTSPQDEIWETMARQALPSLTLPPECQVNFLVGKSINALRELSTSKVPGRVMVYISMYKDNAGNAYNPRDALRRIAQDSQIPIFGVSDTYLGYGIIGGNVVGYADFSRGAAQIALQVLQGTAPESLPVRAYQNLSYFEWPLLQRFGIAESALPTDAIILNRQPDFWDLYQGQIILALAFMVVQTLVISWLLLVMRQRKAAQMALRASEERYREMVEGSNDLIAKVDTRGVYTFVNHSVRDILGLGPQDCTGRSSFDFIHPEDRQASREAFASWIAQGLRATSFENRLVHRDGSVKTMLWNVALEYQNGNLTEIKAIARDITALRRMVVEKDALLQEVYHRTKNNMQVIAALLELQAMRSTSPEVQGIMRGMIQRIRSMAILHQKLYEASDLSRIGLRQYIESLLHDLCSSMLGPDGAVQVDLDLDEHLEMGIEMAVPCGLVVHELLCNAVRHGQPADEHKQVVSVRLTTIPDPEAPDNPGLLIMEIGDNGRGFDPQLPGTSSGMGMQIIQTLVESQLKGHIEFVKHQGTLARVTIPL